MYLYPRWKILRPSTNISRFFNFSIFELVLTSENAGEEIVLYCNSGIKTKTLLFFERTKSPNTKNRVANLYPIFVFIHRILVIGL